MKYWVCNSLQLYASCTFYTLSSLHADTVNLSKVSLIIPFSLVSIYCPSAPSLDRESTDSLIPPICNWLLYISQLRSQAHPPFQLQKICSGPGVKVKPDDTEIYHKNRIQI